MRKDNRLLSYILTQFEPSVTTELGRNRWLALILIEAVNCQQLTVNSSILHTPTPFY